MSGGRCFRTFYWLSPLWVLLCLALHIIFLRRGINIIAWEGFTVVFCIHTIILTVLLPFVYAALHIIREKASAVWLAAMVHLLVYIVKFTFMLLTKTETHTVWDVLETNLMGIVSDIICLAPAYTAAIIYYCNLTFANAKEPNFETIRSMVSPFPEERDLGKG